MNLLFFIDLKKMLFHMKNSLLNQKEKDEAKKFFELKIYLI